MCVTADAGIPILTRTLGDEKALSFPVMGSLNGIDMFAQNHGVKILNTRAGKAKIVWKIFRSSIKLIIISKDASLSDFQFHVLLDNIFHAMVLFMGLSELEEISNVERLKRELRGSTCLIDSLLCGNALFGNVTQCVDIILCNNTTLLQDSLDAFVSACDSEFGCLLVYGKIAVATDKWWQLLPSETMLLLLLLRSVRQASARDFPIYLPHGSPNIPHRLMTMEILEGIEVCVICGPQPLLQTVLQDHVGRYWQPAAESLRACSRSHPRNVPSFIVLDTCISGFILVNVEDGKCLASVYPHGSMTGVEVMNDEKRREVLLQFYLSVVGVAYIPEDADEIENVLTDCRFQHEITETYVCTDQYKLYSKQIEYHQIFILFAKETPTYALNTLTSRTLKVLTKDPSV